MINYLGDFKGTYQYVPKAVVSEVIDLYHRTPALFNDIFMKTKLYRDTIQEILDENYKLYMWHSYKIENPEMPNKAINDLVELNFNSLQI